MAKQTKTTTQLDEKTLKDPDLLSKGEIEQLLPLLDELINWAKKVQDYALKQALAGETYSGYKVVEGITRRRITDEDGAVKALTAAGYAEELLFERKLQSLTKLEALVGKKNFAALVGKFVEKPQGAPVLVPESDSREPYKSSAADDFADARTKGGGGCNEVPRKGATLAERTMDRSL